MDEIFMRIGSIKFACLSPEEIRKMSVMKVITADTYDEFDYPIPGGLMDKRMGVIEPSLRCETCKQKMNDCPGHFGHIELAKPVIHVGFVKEIKMLLESTCPHCGRLLMKDKDIEAYRAAVEENAKYSGNDAYKIFHKELAKIYANCVTRIKSKYDVPEVYNENLYSCPHCGSKVTEMICFDKPTSFRAKRRDSGSLSGFSDRTIQADEIRQIFEKMTDSDISALGYNPETFRPEWMILTVLPVPPVRVRPTIIQGARKQEDDLTHKLVDIIKINHKLGEQRDAGSPLLIVDDLCNLLQLHITQYFDNQTSGTPPANHRGSTRPLKTLTQRLKGKEGRFRSNLSGKRVNFSARTVISPDPLLSINEVGVPEEIARKLTVRLYVTKQNKDAVIELIRGGQNPKIIEETPGHFVIYRDDKEGPSTMEIEDSNAVAKGIIAKCKGVVDDDGKYMPGVINLIKIEGNDERKFVLLEGTRDVHAENLMAIDPEEMAKADVPKYFVVERQLMDGDVVLFNRQPSLHRMSMMAHRVRVIKGHTFRFNLCDCPPYNADFDGDEMNLHVLQSEEARAEARMIMMVQENILSPRYGGPIIGAIHDHITGAYFLTHDDKAKGGPFFTKQETMSILTKLRDVKIPEPDMVKDGVEYWSGKTLFSLVLPHNEKTTYSDVPVPYNDMFKSAICRGKDCKHAKCLKEKCDYDAFVTIVDGKLVSGTIDVKAIGNSKGRILDRIARDYGNTRASMFINQVTKLALGAIMNHGFSTGIDDEDISEDAKMEIASYNKDKIDEVDRLVDSFRNDTLEPMAGRSKRETLEVKAQGVLSDARDKAGEIAEKQLGMGNPAVVMAKIGARGSMLNLSQMAGCVGQQSVRGERLSRGYAHRTLPHFAVGDLGANARGYVENSYKGGLTPTEFFFHAMGGREGLVDTAVRTSRSGYMQRRLVSALEDLKIAQDGTVRNTAGNIIQFSYGEDGSDPSKTIQGKVIDYDDLFIRVLGKDEAEKLNQIEDESAGGDDYGARDRDLEQVEEMGDDDSLDSGEEDGE